MIWIHALMDLVPVRCTWRSTQASLDKSWSTRWRRCPRNAVRIFESSLGLEKTLLFCISKVASTTGRTTYCRRDHIRDGGRSCCRRLSTSHGRTLQLVHPLSFAPLERLSPRLRSFLADRTELECRSPHCHCRCCGQTCWQFVAMWMSKKASLNFKKWCLTAPLRIFTG